MTGIPFNPEPNQADTGSGKNDASKDSELSKQDTLHLHARDDLDDHSRLGIRNGIHGIFICLLERTSLSHTEQRIFAAIRMAAVSGDVPTVPH